MIENLVLTDEQLKEYIKLVNIHGKEREKNFGAEDTTAFACGAMVLFFATGNEDKIPAGWVFLPMMDKSPFG